jgi:hypothetical protein
MPIFRLKANAKQQDLLSLSSGYRFLLPGDDPTKKGNILIIEDALFSVYHHLYPLCKEHNIRILLGLAPRYIVEMTNVSIQTRLGVPYALSMQDEFFKTQTPFCTWQELYEMVRSGVVEVASHSFSKMNLTFPFVNLEREIIGSKKVIEERLPQVVTSFIYPFRQTTKRVHKVVSEHYQYIF